MKPQGSRGAEAIEAACLAVKSYVVEAPARPPAFEYTLPGRPANNGARPEGRLHAPGFGQDTIAGAVRTMRSGEISSSALVCGALDVIARLDPELNAMAHVDAAGALEEAERCDAEAAAGERRGPLHGVPVTVKDVIDVAGMPTRCGSAAYERIPSADAESVARLRAAGAVLLGKATTHEFALGVTSPQSRNPHDASRIPGGSSGGSAIAVATGMGLGSLGTDTRASIRVPAALCGVVGFKPTYGSVPTRGIVPLSWTMDHVSPMAATVGDAALLLDVLAPGRNLQQWVGSSVESFRVGVPQSTFAGADSRIAERIMEVLSLLKNLGATVKPSRRPTDVDLEMSNAAGMLVSRCEAATFHRNLELDRSLYWDEVADQLEAAGSVPAMDYIDAQRMRAELADQMTAIFGEFDVLAMPTVPVVAPPVEDFSRYLLTLSRNAIPWSLTGLPAVSVPCGTVDGLPIGLQLVAAPWRESRLIAMGSALEAALL